MTCEPTGATAVVVESIDASLRPYIGRSGTIISESVNCFHIAYETLEADKGNVISSYNYDVTFYSAGHDMSVLIALLSYSMLKFIFNDVHTTIHIA